MERVRSMPSGLAPIITTAAVVLLAAVFYFFDHKTTAYFILLAYALIFLTAVAYVVLASVFRAMEELRNGK